jgi:polycystin 1L2
MFNNKMKSHQIGHCTKSFSDKLQETSSFNYGWSSVAPFNSSFKPIESDSLIYDSFQFKTADELQGSSFNGKYNTYPGSGYVYSMRGKLSYIYGNLTRLQQLNWIDRQTRAVFVEFSSFNPNLNTFMVTTILIEILPIGNLVTKSRFDPLDLFNNIQNVSSFEVFCYFVYMTFIVWFMVKEVRTVYRLRCLKYFTVWALIQWTIIISSWIGFGIYIYRLKTAYEVLDFFKKTSGYGYIKLQKINEWNQVLTMCIGICAFMGTLNFLKLLRFNAKISYLTNTLKHSANDLIGFSIVFLIVWLAFVQLMYLVFVDKIRTYSTILMV